MLVFTPDRVAIEKVDGTVVAERHIPKDLFAATRRAHPGTTLHRTYFNGYALWAYLTTLYLLAMDGVRVEETEHGRGSATREVVNSRITGNSEIIHVDV